MKAFLGFLLFIVCVFVLILLLVGSYILRAVRNMRKAAMQAAEQQAHQHRTETGRQRRQYSQRSQNAHQSQEPQVETIIDNRTNEHASRKIFDDSDGEYVEFEEVKS